MLRRIVFIISISLVMLVGQLSVAADKDTDKKTAKPAATAPANPTSAVDKNPVVTPSSERLSGKVIAIGVLGAIGLILPFPLVLYHFRQVRLLLAQIDELQQKIRDQEALGARLESLLSRNEKLETESKNLQERFRVTMRNEQEKYQEMIEKLRSDMHALELENKRVNGVLLLKEKMSNKSTS